MRWRMGSHTKDVICDQKATRPVIHPAAISIVSSGRSPCTKRAARYPRPPTTASAPPNSSACRSCARDSPLSSYPVSLSPWSPIGIEKSLVFAKPEKNSDPSNLAFKLVARPRIAAVDRASCAGYVELLRELEAAGSRKLAPAVLSRRHERFAGAGIATPVGRRST